MAKNRPRGLIVVIILLCITTVVTTLFWLSFFMDTPAQQDSFLARRCAEWYAWERSFWLADAWMTLACLAGAVGLLRRRAWGVLFTLLAGSSLIFLGLMDAVFFLQNDLYSEINADIALEMIIHAWTLAVGAWLVIYTWRQRYLLENLSR